MGGYLARPEGAPKAGIIVLQEIFGVTAHIRRVTDGFAEQGYLALAPALFDRLESGIELEYSDFETGLKLMQKLKLDDVVQDLNATVASLRRGLAETPGAGSKVGAVGYCWGGSIADLAACRADINAAVSYYGRATVGWLNEKPRCPVLYHFGALDPLIPPELGFLQGCIGGAATPCTWEWRWDFSASPLGTPRLPATCWSLASAGTSRASRSSRRRRHSCPPSVRSLPSTCRR